MPSVLILWQGTVAICRHSNSVYASCCVFITFNKTENPAAREMRSIIRFLNAKNMKPAEIRHQLCDVYGEHVMSSSMVQRWVRLFNEGRENVHDTSSRYQVLCIAGSIIPRWRDTKTGATLWQVPQQSWKVYQKVVYSMYIKWQHTWFVIYSCFFLIAQHNLLSG
jgi:hypothetical protein